mmetsp:Transcript_8193/g.23416  ORF Transcript_8193/g.23416 Transcript_8193/m.23416 type:complete len:219 (+) Transcript_8193:595-1251(+)
MGMIEHDVVESSINSIVDVVSIVILERSRISYCLHHHTTDSSLTSGSEGQKGAGLLGFLVELGGGSNERVRHTLHRVKFGLHLFLVRRTKHISGALKPFRVQIQSISVDIDFLLSQLLTGEEHGIVLHTLLDIGKDRIFVEANLDRRFALVMDEVELFVASHSGQSIGRFNVIDWLGNEVCINLVGANSHHRAAKGGRGGNEVSARLTNDPDPGLGRE